MHLLTNSFYFFVDYRYSLLIVKSTRFWFMPLMGISSSASVPVDLVLDNLIDPLLSPMILSETEFLLPIRTITASRSSHPPEPSCRHLELEENAPDNWTFPGIWPCHRMDNSLLLLTAETEGYNSSTPSVVSSENIAETWSILVESSLTIMVSLIIIIHFFLNWC